MLANVIAEFGVCPADALVDGDDRLAVRVGLDGVDQVRRDRLVDQRDVGRSVVDREFPHGLNVPLGVDAVGSEPDRGQSSRTPSMMRTVRSQ